MHTNRCLHCLPIQSAYITYLSHKSGGTLLVAQWLRHCTTNLKFVGSIPNSVIGIFH
jgi:hypothetical protein